MYSSQQQTCYQQKRINYHTHQNDGYQIFNLLTHSDFIDHLEENLPEHRERLFPPTETLTMFVAQAMNEDRSCQRIVNDAAVKRYWEDYLPVALIQALIAEPDSACLYLC